MTKDLTIEYLKDNQHLVSFLAETFKKEWNVYYGPEGNGDALSDVNSFCNKDHLPICLIALKRGSFIGSVALRQKSGTHHHLGPWVTSLFVIPEERRNGIGKKLIEAIENLSAKLAYSNIYSRSATAIEFFRKINWIYFDRIEETNLTIFTKSIKPLPLRLSTE